MLVVTFKKVGFDSTKLTNNTILLQYRTKDLDISYH